jgi:hypothetical protein
MEGRVGLEICPVENFNYGEVRWQQMDNYYGLQQLRGMDGAPTRVVRVGRNVYSYDPGIYGEYESVTEMELTKRAGSVSTNTPIPITDLVMECQRQLIQRRFDRLEYNVWTLLINGTISIVIGDPLTGTQIGYQDTYAIQQSNASTAWSNTTTATPIKDMQVVQQLGVGYSVDLGAGATAYMNGYQAYNLLNNTNANDFGGRRDMYGATLNNLDQVNNYFRSQNLPQIKVYDDGYYATQGGNTTAQFTKFIPNGKVLIVGKRPGNVPVAKYLMTRNANNPDSAPGSYTKVINYMDGTQPGVQIGKGIEVHEGHNGGVAMYYPSAVVSLAA